MDIYNFEIGILLLLIGTLIIIFRHMDGAFDNMPKI